MKKSNGWGNSVLIIGCVLVGIAIPHLIDDFLFNVPEEFGLSNMQAQVLAGFFAALLIVVFSLVARGRRWGYIGAGWLGGFLGLAGILKHVPSMLRPGPYWSGLFSEILIWALIVSGMSLLIVSIQALRTMDQSPSGL